MGIRLKNALQNAGVLNVKSMMERCHVAVPQAEAGKAWVSSGCINE
ncbi:MAG: hypothetical protein ACTHKA_05255 [Anaerocolumna jejuensis]